MKESQSFPSMTVETAEIEELLGGEELRDRRHLQDEKDPAKLKQRRPPGEGLCRRCGLDKPINRLMLCYPCWVKSELENTGWREGQSHPDWCACEGLKDHARRSDGN